MNNDQSTAARPPVLAWAVVHNADMALTQSAVIAEAWRKAGLDVISLAPVVAAVAVPDIEVAVLMNRSACRKYPDDINMRLAHNAGWRAACDALASGAAQAVAAPSAADVDTSQRQGCTRSHPHENMSPMCVLRTEIARLNHAEAVAQARDPFQQRVQPWLLACFGAEIAGDKQERNHRFLEEAVELVQANGCTASEAHQLVDYVFGRPVGEPAQEVGGVMVTLAALCLASGLDMHQAGEVELARIWGKVEQIRAKQAAKPKHSPLPAAPAQAQEDARPDVLMGYMHPGAFHPYQYKRWQDGNTVAVRLNGWKDEPLQVPVYAKQSEIDAARAAQGGAA